MKIFVPILALLAVGLAAPQEDNVSFGGKNNAAAANKDQTKDKDSEVESVQVKKVTEEDVGGKAASTKVNCNCQCNDYTWVHAKKGIQGNCKSADHTNAVWCYVPFGSTCGDIKTSRFREDNFGNKRIWSYQACSTPARNSFECRSKFNNGFNNNGNFNRPNRPNRRPNRPNNNFNNNQFNNNRPNNNFNNFNNNRPNNNFNNFNNNRPNNNFNNFNNNRPNNNNFNNNRPNNNFNTDLRNNNQNNNQQNNQNSDSVTFGEQ